MADLLGVNKAMGQNTSLKLHFLGSHIDFFPKNFGTVGSDHGERFHHETSMIEKTNQGKWSPNLLADYSWTKKRDVPDAQYPRKPLYTAF